MTETKQEIQKEHHKQYILKFFIKILIIILVIFMIFQFVFGVASVKGNNMSPYLRDGDLTLFYRLEKNYIVGDIVHFNQNNNQQYARIIAMEGDEIYISEEGNLVINGNIQQEDIFYPTFNKEKDIVFPYVVPKNTVFVLNDYRLDEQDSRNYGAISKEDLDGKLIFFLRFRIY